MMQVVENMLQTVGQALIANREPEQRLRAIIEKFVNHPDIKRVLDTLAIRQLGCGKKELEFVQLPFSWCQ